MSVIKPVYIEKKTEQDPALNFSLLREEGIRLLQELSGKTWTDYNFHDPGVTILEQLCFAITDLAYRTEAPIEDILANIQGNISRADNSFFNREQILTTNPVTVNDFRKAVLDDLVDEVENIQLEPLISSHASEYMKGLYKVMVQVNEDAAARISQEPAYEQEIVRKVMDSFLSRRNLSEDCIRSIVVLKAQDIYIRSDIIIAEHFVPEEVMANIYNKIDFALNPHITRYSEQELVDKGLSIEQIYCGPLLKNGIILDSDLKPFRKEIDPSELIKAISEVEGVLYVKNLVINGDESTGIGKPFRLQDDHFPLLETRLSRQEIKLFTDKYELHVKESVFRNIMRKLHELTHRRTATSPKDPDSTYIKKGTYRNLEHYDSIQYYFPAVYGIGRDGLSVHASERRKAEAKQLKAYLLFFEQVLANYLSQLANVDKLFSPDIGYENANTYYFQDLYHVPGIEDLLSPFSGGASPDKAKQAPKDDNNAYVRTLKKQQETNAEYVERKNRIFDHLLARINKTLNDYPVLMYSSLYGNSGIGKSTDMVLKWKSEILKDMLETNQDRIRAFNYTNRNAKVSGFEKKMLALLHIRERSYQTLTQVFSENNLVLAPGVASQAAGQEVNLMVSVVDDQEDEQNIFLSQEEVNELNRTGDLLPGAETRGDAYVFQNQGLSVLKDGINIENYRIAPLGIAERYSILYKAPSGRQWKAVSSHSDEKVAMKALYRLIRSLKDLSLESEGFYIMEHLLLRPEIIRPAYGFRFYELPDKLLFENQEWLSFEAREAYITKLVGEASSDQPATGPAGSPYKIQMQAGPPVLAAPAEIRDGKKYGAEKEFANIRDNLALLADDQVNFYPRFEFTVKLQDGTVIKEDFFNFRMTVVLPAWPARFQDQDFRTFTEDLFRLNAPAYLRLEFRWIGLADMKDFEGLYFSWLSLFNASAPYEERNSQSAKLIAFLKGSSYK